MAAAAVALALGAAGVALAVRAIGGESVQPSSPIVNGRIAFSGLASETWQIYSIEPDGSGLEQLTHVVDAVAVDPAWSPDGTLIAYVVVENGGSGPSDIWIMNADGSHARQLSTGARSSWSPAWSPDGSQIAFAAGDPSHVYVVDADGTNLSRLTQDGGWCWAGPSWSPDGRHIVFDQSGGECDKDLYVMAADGSGQHGLAELPGWQIEPAWSPDGRTIAFTGSDPERSAFGIHAIDADGTKVRSVTDQAAAQHPAWSPDGRLITFMAPRPGSDHETLFVVPADGGEPREVPGLPKEATSPSWQRAPASASPTALLSTSTEPTSPSTLHLTCDRSSISADETAAAAQPAGVHVEIQNRSEGPLFLQFATEPDGPWGGTEVPPGITELSLQPPPGTLTVRCSDGGDAVTPPLEIEVRDDQGLFVPFDLTCGGGSGIASTIPSSPWPGGGESAAPEPIEFVRTVTEGLLPTDVVERAGYPDAPGGIVRVVRDGAVVAAFGLFQPEDWAPGMLDGWAASMSACAGSGISIPPGPDPYPRGWFEWCPEGPFPEPGRDWSVRAPEVAVRFARAYVDGDQATLADVLDPSVPTGAEFPVSLADGTEPAVRSRDAHGGKIVNYSCGNDVDAYTVAVTIDDGSESASADFTVFVVLREDGWKVWGVY